MFMPMQQPGLFGQQSGLNNPLTHMGMGLLAQNRGPKYSTNIADFRDPGIGAGLLGGLESYNRYQQGQATNQYRQQVIAQNQQKLEFERQQAAAEQAEAARIQAARGEFQKILADPKSTKQQIASAAMAAGSTPQGAAGLLGSPQSLPSDAQTANWLMTATPEQRASYEEMIRLKKPPGTSVDVRYGADANEIAGLLSAQQVEDEGFPPGTVTEIDPKTGKRRILHKPTDTAMKRQTDAAMGVQSLSKIKTILATGKVDPSSSGLAARQAIASSPIARGLIPDRLEPGVTKEEAEVGAMLGQFHKAYIALVRGAQVGPKEEASFMAVLPQFGQSKNVFEANMRASERNYKILQGKQKSSKSKKLDALGQPLLEGEFPPGTIPLPGQ